MTGARIVIQILIYRIIAVIHILIRRLLRGQSIFVSAITQNIAAISILALDDLNHIIGSRVVIIRSHILDAGKVILVIDHIGGQDGDLLVHLNFLVDVNGADISAGRSSLMDTIGHIDGVGRIHEIGRLVNEAMSRGNQLEFAIGTGQFAIGILREGDHIIAVAGSIGFRTNTLQHMAQRLAGDGNEVTLCQLMILGQIHPQAVVQNVHAVYHIGDNCPNRHRRVGVSLAVLYIGDRHIKLIGTGGGVIDAQLAIGDLDRGITGVCCTIGGGNISAGDCRAAQIAVRLNDIRIQLVQRNIQLVAAPLIVLSTGGNVDTHLGGAVSRIRAEIGSSQHLIVKDLGANVILSQFVSKSTNFKPCVLPEAGVVCQDQAGLVFTGGGTIIQKLFQFLICLEHNFRVANLLAVGIVACNGCQQIGDIQRTTLSITDAIFIALLDGQAVQIIDVDADGIIRKHHLVHEGVAQILDGKAILNRAILIDDTAIVNLGVILIGELFVLDRAVRNTDVGNDTHVGTGTVALHVVEVEGVALTFLQRQSGITGLGGTRRHSRVSSSNIVVQVHFHLGDGVGTADIQHQLAVDEQVNVIITFELEEQVVIGVVNELAITLQNVVVVVVDVGCVIGTDVHSRVVKDIRGNRCVLGARMGRHIIGFPNRQERIQIRAGVSTINNMRLTPCVVITNHLVGRIIHNRGHRLLRIQRIGERSVKNVGFLSGTIGQREVDQLQIVELRLHFIVGIGHEQVVQQEVGRVIAGLNIAAAHFPRANELGFSGQSIIPIAQSIALCAQNRPQSRSKVLAAIPVGFCTLNKVVIECITVTLRNLQRCLQMVGNISHRASGIIQTAGAVAVYCQLGFHKTDGRRTTGHLRIQRVLL